MKILRKIYILVALLFFFMTSNQVLGHERADEMIATLQKIDFLLDQGNNQLAWQLLQQPQYSTAAVVFSLKARAQYEMGRVADEADNENALSYFKEAERYARLAIAEAPDLSDGYKWLAIALGAQSKYSNIKTQVKLSRDIKESIEKAISLKPDDDISYLVLSRWHYKVSALGFFAKAYAKLVYGGIPEASLDQSEQLLWTAIQLKDRIAHRYNLAKVYDRKGQRKEAVEQLQHALLLPVTFPEEVEELEKAQEKLQKWQ